MNRDPAVSPARTQLLTKFGRVLPLALLILYGFEFALFLVWRGGLAVYVRSTDFMPTLAAAQQIAIGQGAAIFDLDAQQAAQAAVLAPYRTLTQVLPYLHPPYEALLIVPLMPLGYITVTLVWIALSILALTAALFLLQRVLPIARPWLYLLVIYSISYQPVFRALSLAQNTMLVLLGICLTFAAVRQRNRRWDMVAGMGLLLVSFKLQVLPLVLLLVLIEGRWRALVWFGGLSAALVVVCMPVLGIAWPLQYLDLLRMVSQWDANAAVNPAIMHNWRGLVVNTVGPFSPQSASRLTIALNVISLALFGVGGWMLRTPLTHKRRAAELDLLWALGIVTAMLIASHLHPHDLTLLIFPAWVLVSRMQTATLPVKLSRGWLRLLQIEYAFMALTFFVQADAPLWVVANVTLLGVGTLLLLATIRAVEASPTESIEANRFDRVTAKD